MTSFPAADTEQTADVVPHSRGGEAFILRLRFLCAMAVAATIFWYVGWWVAGPVDPQGPVSLLLVDHGVITMAELLGLAVVTSGLAVAICGAGSAERGPLAIAIGMATLGLRGFQLDRLVLYRLGLQDARGAGPDPFPTWELIAECWLWLALISVGFVVGRWVEGWFGPRRPDAPSNPVLVDHSSDVRQGLGRIVVISLVGWAVISFTVGNDTDPILKGQIYFSIGIAFLLGGLAAHWLFPAVSRVWALVAVALLATIAYIFGGPDSAAIEAARAGGTYLNIESVARPLPIEFAAMGAVGVLLEADAMRSLRAMFGLTDADRPRPSFAKGD
ncbi:MAG: hypothetical protein JXQ75_23860 [Phycisphaerae bacterium]|nr:hypothetical protein [Phycisphaerae bacterium]